MSQIDRSFIETIQNSELSNLAIDAADSTSGIPIFGALQKLWGGIHSVHAHFYTKKVLKFLEELSSIPKEIRQQQLSKMLVVPGEREKFGEHISLMLDRMNEIEKAKLMGKVARAYVEGRITLDDMKSLNFALVQIDLRLADGLKSASESWSDNEDIGPSLAQCGLMTAKLDIETEPLEIKTADIDDFYSKTDRYETFKSARLRLFPGRSKTDSWDKACSLELVNRDGKCHPLVH